jgi:hypothetical protein
MMKKNFILLFIFTFFVAQAQVKTVKAGQCFDITLPVWMSKTAGLNSAAAIQYKNVVKDVYGFVIYDTKEELTFVDMHYTSVSEFYEDFIGDFLKEEEKREVSKVNYTNKGDNHYAEADVSYFDKDANTEIYYLVGIVETKSCYYKVLSWCTKANKEKYKADLQKIIYSIKD